jgi:hypothetical protein
MESKRNLALSGRVGATAGISTLGAAISAKDEAHEFTPFRVVRLGRSLRSPDLSR